MIPSFYIFGDSARAWSITHAAAYGAVIGALAGVFKLLRPLHVVSAPSETHLANGVLEIAGAALVFALLCAGVSALRNFIMRRLIWPETR